MANNNQNLLIGALLGGVLGAATLLLFTPVSGAKVRQKIANRLSTFRHEPVTVQEPPLRKKKTVNAVKGKVSIAETPKRRKKASV